VTKTSKFTALLASIAQAGILPYHLGVGASGLREMLHAAARGELPTPDGRLDVVPTPSGAAGAIVAFTAHHVVAADVTKEEVLERIPPGDLDAPLGVPFLTWFGDRIGARPDGIDVMLVADPIPGLVAFRPLDDADHPRARRARRVRTDVEVYGDETGVIAIGRGLAGRIEVSIEVREEERGRGTGRLLAHAARTLGPRGEPLFAQVAPGNAAALHAFLAAGFRPIGAEVLFFPG
jgi:GNAT superfamily N-acetyltransferase